MPAHHLDGLGGGALEAEADGAVFAAEFVGKLEAHDHRCWIVIHRHSAEAGDTELDAFRHDGAELFQIRFDQRAALGNHGVRLWLELDELFAFVVLGVGDEELVGAHIATAAEAGGEFEIDVVVTMNDVATKFAIGSVPGDFLAVDGDERFVTDLQTGLHDAVVKIAVGVGEGEALDLEVLLQKVA